MQTLRLGSGNLVSSRLAYGCWRIARSGVETLDVSTARQAVHAAVEAGYTLFDHADIYCEGRAESAFGAVLRETPSLRKDMLIASKCGIRFAGEPDAAAPYRYDFSSQYIIASCERSLRRLGIETIDLFQLHRPDWLMDAEEVAGAFERLHHEGKVREFGVSNFSPSQVSLLRGASRVPISVNQVEISLLQHGRLEDGTLDQCQAEKITPMAWSPLGGGLLADGAVDILPSQKLYEPLETLRALDALALEKNTTRTALSLAWLLKHPAGIVPIVGSINPARIRAAARAIELELTREEWYRLTTASLGRALP